MEIEYAFLADAAQNSSDGKLYVLGGGISQIAASRFPATHPQMALVVKLRLHATEADRDHAMEIEMWDEDGQTVGDKVKNSFHAKRREDFPGRELYFQMVLNILGAQFPSPGTYDFHISVDGRFLKSVPIELIALQAHSQPMESP